MTTNIKKVSIALGLATSLVIVLLLLMETRTVVLSENTIKLTAKALPYVALHTGTDWLVQLTCNLLTK